MNHIHWFGGHYYQPENDFDELSEKKNVSKGTHVLSIENFPPFSSLFLIYFLILWLCISVGIRRAVFCSLLSNRRSLFVCSSVICFGEHFVPPCCHWCRTGIRFQWRAGGDAPPALVFFRPLVFFLVSPFVGRSGRRAKDAERRFPHEGERGRTTEEQKKERGGWKKLRRLEGTMNEIESVVLPTYGLQYKTNKSPTSKSIQDFFFLFHQILFTSRTSRWLDVQVNNPLKWLNGL